MLIDRISKLEFAFKLNEKSLIMIHFFKQKPFGIYMLIIIMKKFYLGKYFEKEKLKDLIFTSSRTTISNFISEAIDKKILILSKPENDKRKRILKPSDQLIDEFEEWVNIVSNK